ncbi:proline glycine betaine transporter [Nannochloropsis gaditana]|uniref:Proline glycine betaine transporter n=1 Tax=Nannochloropsis gaditana TaxID=72520 RepID=W7T262_9STRA|nr:proline glycine betaine transporter [Nannochloropsis gaditana]
MDFSAYGFFAEEIGQAFFPPSTSSTVRLIRSFAVFSGAFLFRPIGGLFFGWLGDTYSKKHALVLSLSLMALATTGVGFLPPYSSIHILSPILLTLLRLLQGFSVGGQLVGTMVFVAHHAFQPPPPLPSSSSSGSSPFRPSPPPSSLQGFYGDLRASSTEGQHLAVDLVAPSPLPPTGSPHADVGPPSGISTQAAPRDKDREDREEDENPIGAVFHEHLLEIVLGIGVTALWCGGVYQCYIWMPTYLTVLAPHAPVPALFGGTVSVVATALVKTNGGLGPEWLLMGTALLSSGCLVMGWRPTGIVARRKRRGRNAWKALMLAMKSMATTCPAARAEV